MHPTSLRKEDGERRNKNEVDKETSNIHKHHKQIWRYMDTMQAGLFFTNLIFSGAGSLRWGAVQLLDSAQSPQSCYSSSGLGLCGEQQV